MQMSAKVIKKVKGQERPCKKGIWVLTFGVHLSCKEQYTILLLAAEETMYFAPVSDKCIRKCGLQKCNEW